MNAHKKRFLRNYFNENCLKWLSNFQIIQKNFDVEKILNIILNESHKNKIRELRKKSDSFLCYFFYLRNKKEILYFEKWFKNEWDNNKFEKDNILFENLNFFLEKFYIIDINFNSFPLFVKFIKGKNKKEKKRKYNALLNNFRNNGYSILNNDYNEMVDVMDFLIYYFNIILKCETQYF